MHATTLAPSAKISDEFMIFCEQRGTEVVDSAGKAKEQQGKVEHHAQQFELMPEDVLADLQPQTEYEWRECLDALPEAKNSLLSVSGVSSMQLVFGRNPEIPGDLSSENRDLIASSSLLTRQRRWTGGESPDNREKEMNGALRQAESQGSAGHLTTSGTNVPPRRHGCSVAHDEKRWYSWETCT